MFWEHLSLEFLYLFKVRFKLVSDWFRVFLKSSCVDFHFYESVEKNAHINICLINFCIESSFIYFSVALILNDSFIDILNSSCWLLRFSDYKFHFFESSLKIHLEVFYLLNVKICIIRFQLIRVHHVFHNVSNVIFK